MINTPKNKIIVDTLGADLGIAEVVRGVLCALETSGKSRDFTIILVGKEKVIKEEITKETQEECRFKNIDNKIEIVNVEKEISNYDSPIAILRDKKDCSMAVALQLLSSDSYSTALVSCGSTGALLVGSSIIVGKEDGLDRLSLAAMLPTFNDIGKVLFLDCGANVDCKQEYLVQFAKIGSSYVRNLLGIDKPKVGLLNVGTEPGKGNLLAKNAYDMLGKSDINFVGNIEARDVLKGSCDVVVCDGFWGNIFIKTIEGMSDFVREKMSLDRTITCGMTDNLDSLDRFINYSNYSHGGAILLGAKKPIYKSHGNSNSQTIKQTILQAMYNNTTYNNKLLSEQR